jgi:hypothetical protein
VDEALNDDQEDSLPPIMQAEGGEMPAAAKAHGAIAGDFAARNGPGVGVYFFKGFCYHHLPRKFFLERRALPGSPLVLFPACRFRSRSA